MRRDGVQSKMSGRERRMVMMDKSGIAGRNWLDDREGRHVVSRR